jgi:GMP synthase PP-ATPase subunit
LIFSDPASHPTLPTCCGRGAAGSKLIDDEAHEIHRLTLDISCEPRATIEWK